MGVSADVDVVAQPRHATDGLGTPTKTGRLAELLADPEVRRRIGSGWPLYMMLALEWGGTASGTREGIGARMTEDGRNVGNWVASLERAGIVNVEKHGRRMMVTLAGEHMAAARIADSVVVAKATEPAEDDPELARLVSMYRAAKAAGAKLRLLTESEFESGKSS